MSRGVTSSRVRTGSIESVVSTELLRKRVAVFGLVAGGLGAIMWVYRFVLILVSGETELLVDPSVTTHLFATVALLLVWALNGFAERSRGFVQTTELVGVVAGCVGYELMGATIPPLFRPDLVVVLALTLTLMARAVWVPSTGIRTAAITGVAFAPLVAIVYMAYVQIEPAQLAAMQEGRGVAAEDRSPAREVAFYVAMTTGVWGVMLTLLTTGASHVIYGLRRKAHRAERLGQYVLEHEIGSGGMGIVYRARHAMLKRPTAVKLLLPERTGAEGLARFEREVQQTARLTHPNTITIFDYGHTPDGVFYYAMEYLEGADLQEIVSVDGAQHPARVLHVMHQVAGALAEAHGIGLIHRDVKPSNVILCSRGGMRDVAKVVDFGLVKDLSPDAPHLSTAQTITGTPAYMAPEAVRDPEAADARIDVYALGAVGYFLLTGQELFQGRNSVEVIGHHLHSVPPPPSERLGREVPADLERLLVQCLDKDPGARPATMIELRRRLADCEVFGQWDPDTAAAWWTEVGPELDRLRARARGTPVSQPLPVRLSP